MGGSRDGCTADDVAAVRAVLAHAEVELGTLVAAVKQLRRLLASAAVDDAAALVVAERLLDARRDAVAALLDAQERVDKVLDGVPRGRMTTVLPPSGVAPKGARPKDERR